MLNDVFRPDRSTERRPAGTNLFPFTHFAN